MTCRRTAHLQHREAQVLLAALRNFRLEPFTRGDLVEASGLPVNVVCGRVFTLIQRGALKELSERRNWAGLLKVVIKQPRGKR
ncbi:MAG: hypothetical protein M0Z99_32210 [Betaproteobacteria bacterium]|nr:hypothetical protein [Betaproteobacteria bacterium]